MVTPSPDFARFFSPLGDDPPRATARPAPPAPPAPAPASPWGRWSGGGFDGGVLRMLGSALFRPMADQALHTGVRGAEHLPLEGPAIAVLNHTGATWLRDLAVLLQRWSAHAGHDHTRIPRAFSLPLFFDPGHLAGAPPALRAPSARHFETVLGEGGIVLWYAEHGADIIGQGVRRGPHPFHPFFVELALKYNAAIVPIACLSTEPFFWGSRDPFASWQGPRFQVGEPVRVQLDPATATTADQHAAAAALRAQIMSMLADLHGSRPRPPSTPFAGAGPERWVSSLFARHLGHLDPPPVPDRPWSGARADTFSRPPPTPAADAALSRRVAVLEAQGEVSRAMFTWGRALDRVERTKDLKDAQYIADVLMTEDGVLDFAAVGWGVWGPEKKSLVAEILKFSRSIGWSYHTYPNGEIDVDLAAGTARYFTSTELVPLAKDGVFQWFFLTQRTDFRRVGNAWKVQRYTLSDLRVASSAPDPW